MFSNLDTLHSYDPLEVIKLLLSIIANFFNSLQPSFDSLMYFLINFFAKYIVFSVVFSISLIIFIMLYSKKYEQVQKEIMKKIIPEDGKAESTTGGKIENPKWKLVQDHINSDDPSKWKLAIIEGDIILSELLNTLNLPGNGIGEQLKSVEKSDFETLDDAWEAHKIRNAIAHEGSDFLLNNREAKRIIGLYEKVFNEFEMI